MVGSRSGHGVLRTEQGYVDVKRAVFEEGSLTASELEQRLGIPENVVEAVLRQDPDTCAERDGHETIFRSRMH